MKMVWNSKHFFRRPHSLHSHSLAVFIFVQWFRCSQPKNGWMILLQPYTDRAPRPTDVHNKSSARFMCVTLRTDRRKKDFFLFFYLIRRHDECCNRRRSVSILLFVYSAQQNTFTITTNRDYFMWSNVFLFFLHSRILLCGHRSSMHLYQAYDANTHIVWLHWSPRIHRRCSNVTKKLTKRKTERKFNSNGRQKRSLSVKTKRNEKNCHSARR